MLANNNLVSSFSDPFRSIAMRYYPTTMEKAFELAEWMYNYNGVYKAAIERSANLFYTQLIYSITEDTTAKDKLKDILENNYKVKTAIINAGIDKLNYGNAFLTIYLPFKRQIYCPNCKGSAPIENSTNIEYRSPDKFYGTCPLCNSTGELLPRDTPYKDMTRLNIVRLNPKRIDLIHNPISGNTRYIWDIDDEFRDMLKDSRNTPLLYDTPLKILEAAIQNKNIEFKEDEILHIKHQNLSGLDSGWGLPPGLSCFPLVFYIAILMKANEAISMDYIIPLRILYPQNASQFGEASVLSGPEMIGRIKAMITNHKVDPLAWHTSPTPLGYQVIGGEKRSLMIADDIKLSTDLLLNSMGHPAEFFYGSMGIQATPMALRLIQNSYGLTECYNTIIKWITKKLCKYLSLPPIGVSFLDLKWSDDYDKRQFMLQAASADKVSEITLLELYGIDWEEEQRKKIKQRQLLVRLNDEASEKLKEEQQQQQQAPSGLANSPQAKMEEAQAVAQQLFSQPYEVRRSQLIEMGKVDPILHALVKQFLAEMRQGGGQQQ